VHVRICPQRNVTNLSSNVLAFAIAISPDEQDAGISGLRLDVARYSLFVLHGISQLPADDTCITHLCYARHYGCLEQC
jgi:hypothetical protein